MKLTKQHLKQIILEQAHDAEVERQAKDIIDDVGADELLRLDDKGDGSLTDELMNRVEARDLEAVESKILDLIGAEVTVHGSGGSDILSKIS